ncbi:hypothetical protein F5B21DRAFT_475142 [Xylaria acuta]|nr:hypothetical protein F5B21DRAFT_475142 [Xylaria acuta]
MTNYADDTSQAGTVDATADEWVTVTYKKPTSTNKNKPGIRARGRGRGRGQSRGRDRGRSSRTFGNGSRRAASSPRRAVKQETVPAAPTYASVATNGSRASSASTSTSTSTPSSSLADDITTGGAAGEGGEALKQKPRRGGGGRGQIQQNQCRSFEQDIIQGPLPGWYKPPDWDVKPARHDRNGEK